MLANRIRYLEKEHERLDKEIDTLEKIGRFSDMQLNDLRKQRLHIKDELTRLRRQEYEEQQRVGWDDDER
jgi:uncharacterized protein YdcH (DUF465 family)